MKLITQ